MLRFIANHMIQRWQRKLLTGLLLLKRAQMHQSLSVINNGQGVDLYPTANFVAIFGTPELL